MRFFSRSLPFILVALTYTCTAVDPGEEIRKSASEIREKAKISHRATGMVHAVSGSLILAKGIQDLRAGHDNTVGTALWCASGLANVMYGTCLNGIGMGKIKKLADNISSRTHNLRQGAAAAMTPTLLHPSDLVRPNRREPPTLPVRAPTVNESSSRLRHTNSLTAHSARPITPSAPPAPDHISIDVPNSPSHRRSSSDALSPGYSRSTSFANQEAFRNVEPRSMVNYHFTGSI